MSLHQPLGWPLHQPLSVPSILFNWPRNVLGLHARLPITQTLLACFANIRVAKLKPRHPNDSRTHPLIKPPSGHPQSSNSASNTFLVVVHRSPVRPDKRLRCMIRKHSHIRSTRTWPNCRKGGNACFPVSLDNNTPREPRLGFLRPVNLPLSFAIDLWRVWFVMMPFPIKVLS